MPLAEQAVGDVAEEREAGDDDDDQPELLRIPGSQGSVLAVRKERQDGASDNRIAGEGIDVLRVEPLDEAVELRLEREDLDRDRRSGDCEALAPAPREEPDRDGNQRCDGRR